MNKILLIIKREYLTRVRKKSFIVMTILGPLLMAAIMIVPIFIAKLSDEKKEIAVIDDSGLFFGKFIDTDNIHFSYMNMSETEAKSKFPLLYINEPKKKANAILHIPDIAIYSAGSIRLISDKQLSISVKSYIENSVQKELESIKLSASGIDKAVLAAIETKVKIASITLKPSGKEERGFTEISMVLGLFSGILIYFFIFMFGAQVMRGVIEEKTNRIIEIIVSSVKPFQLMMGKIIGVAMVGLTQFLLWVLLTFTIVTVVQKSFPDMFRVKESKTMPLSTNKVLNAAEIKDQMQEVKADKSQIKEVITAIRSIDFGLMISAFIFYFIFGYLIYAALFAAIGSAVDNEADTQQFMLPVTIPLIFAIIMAQFIMNNPDGPIAFWLSIFPLTSPIIMMVRIPFGVSTWEVLLSMILLIGGFLGATWLAGRIYRTGILMYGKKVSYKELWKWLFYKA